jgi:hypothetical protein
VESQHRLRRQAADPGRAKIIGCPRACPERSRRIPILGPGNSPLG